MKVPSENVADDVLVLVRHPRSTRLVPAQQIADLSHAPGGPRSAITDLPVQSAEVGSASRSSSRERDESYGAIVAMLNERWRIIVCRDAIQWILQRRSGPSSWKSNAFCRSKSGLLRCVMERAGQVEPAAEAFLACLPNRIGIDFITVFQQQRENKDHET